MIRIRLIYRSYIFLLAHKFFLIRIYLLSQLLYVPNPLSATRSHVLQPWPFNGVWLEMWVWLWRNSGIGSLLWGEPCPREWPPAWIPWTSSSASQIQSCPALSQLQYPWRLEEQTHKQGWHWWNPSWESWVICFIYKTMCLIIQTTHHWYHVLCMKNLMSKRKNCKSWDIWWFNWQFLSEEHLYRRDSFNEVRDFHW